MSLDAILKTLNESAEEHRRQHTFVQKTLDLYQKIEEERNRIDQYKAGISHSYEKINEYLEALDQLNDSVNPESVEEVEEPTHSIPMFEWIPTGKTSARTRRIAGCEQWFGCASGNHRAQVMNVCTVCHRRPTEDPACVVVDGTHPDVHCQAHCPKQASSSTTPAPSVPDADTSESASSASESVQRKCSKCKQLKDLTTDFPKNANCAGGYEHTCKACKKIERKRRTEEKKKKQKSTESDSTTSSHAGSDPEDE